MKGIACVSVVLVVIGCSSSREDRGQVIDAGAAGSVAGSTASIGGAAGSAGVVQGGIAGVAPSGSAGVPAAGTEAAAGSATVDAGTAGDSGPAPCESLTFAEACAGRVCGEVDAGCGAVYLCGGCPGNVAPVVPFAECVDGRCVYTCAGYGLECGSHANVGLECGACAEGECGIFEVGKCAVCAHTPMGSTERACYEGTPALPELWTGCWPEVVPAGCARTPGVDVFPIGYYCCPAGSVAR